MVPEVHQTRDRLRLSVAAMKLFSEWNGCAGFVTQADVDEANTLDDVALAVFVEHLADTVERIDDTAVRTVLTRLRRDIVSYLAQIGASARDYARMSDAYSAYARAS